MLCVHSTYLHSTNVATKNYKLQSRLVSWPVTKEDIHPQLEQHTTSTSNSNMKIQTIFIYLHTHTYVCVLYVYLQLCIYEIDTNKNRNTQMYVPNEGEQSAEQLQQRRRQRL